MTAVDTLAEPASLRPGRLRLTLRYLRRNKALSIGLAIMFGLIAFTAVGFLTIDPKDAYPLSAPTRPLHLPHHRDALDPDSLIESGPTRRDGAARRLAVRKDPLKGLVHCHPLGHGRPNWPFICRRAVHNPR